MESPGFGVLSVMIAKFLHCDEKLKGEVEKTEDVCLGEKLKDFDLGCWKAKEEKLLEGIDVWTAAFVCSNDTWGFG